MEKKIFVIGSVCLLCSTLAVAAHAQSVAFAPAAVPIQITPVALPDAVAGVPYMQTLTVMTSESGPFYWTVDGALPDGLSLDTTQTGAGTEISGTPSAAGAATFSVSVTNRDIAATQTYFLTVDAAGTTSASSTSSPELTLQAQLDAIAAGLQQLQNGISGAAGTGGQGQVLGASTGSAAAVPTFYRDLTVGDAGPDVLALQQFLNNEGYPIAASGPGSPGNETEFFGPATQAALVKWQAATGITPAAGYFGPVTRAQINLLTASTESATLPLQSQIESTEL